MVNHRVSYVKDIAGYGQPYLPGHDDGRAVCGTKELFFLCHFKTLSVGSATLDLPLCTPPLYWLSINRVRVIV